MSKDQLVLKESLGGSEDVDKVGEEAAAAGDVSKGNQEMANTIASGSSSGDIKDELSNGNETGEKRKRGEDEEGVEGQKNNEGQKESDEIDSNENEKKKHKAGDNTEEAESSGWFPFSGLWSSEKKPEDNEQRTGTSTSTSTFGDLGTQILRMEALAEKNSSWSPFSTSNIRRNTSVEQAGWGIKCNGDADISFQMLDMGNGLMRIRFKGMLNGEVSKKNEGSENFVAFEVKVGEQSNQVCVKVPAAFELKNLEVTQVEDGVIDVIAQETECIGDENENKEMDSGSAEEDEGKNQKDEDEETEDEED